MMAGGDQSLLPFYAGWRTYNERLVAAIAPLTPQQLALRTTPEHWTIGMYTTHIVANRAWWFHTRMGEGGDEITPLSYGRWASPRPTWIRATARRCWSRGSRRRGR